MRFKEFITEGESVKYKGTYNWHSENVPLYCTAASKEQAHTLLQAQLAKKLKVIPAKVTNYYKKNPNGYKITEVKPS